MTSLQASRCLQVIMINHPLGLCWGEELRSSSGPFRLNLVQIVVVPKTKLASYAQILLNQTCYGYCVGNC